MKDGITALDQEAVSLCRGGGEAAGVRSLDRRITVSNGHSQWVKRSSAMMEA